MSFEDARAVADAVLFEGYALYPYRASAPKNRLRWQFGVLAPRAWSEAGGGDAWWQETQVLVEPGRDGDGAGPVRVDGKLRFLQLRRRTVTGDAAPPPWDEGSVQEIDFAWAPSAAPDGEQVATFRVAGGRDVDGTVAHERWPLSGAVRMFAEPAVAGEPLLKLRVRIENLTAWSLPGAPRDEAMRASLLGAHVLLSARGGAFVSLLEPPPAAVAAAAACRSVRTYPVLAGAPGRRDLVLSAPVILYDHPAVAPESPRDLFDATEIDEILSLRVLTLTDDEKREVRATDPRLAALLDGVERLGLEGLGALHGAARELHPVGASERAAPRADEVSPAHVMVGGAAIGPGSRVRLRPGARRTDAQDMFLMGMTATVEAILRDVEDRDSVAVTLDDDPANEVLRWQRRFLYFSPDELEPLP